MSASTKVCRDDSQTSFKESISYLEKLFIEGRRFDHNTIYGVCAAKVAHYCTTCTCVAVVGSRTPVGVSAHLSASMRSSAKLSKEASASTSLPQ